MSRTKVIYPGSFDPFTVGHLDMVRRIANMFDEVVIGLLINPEKKMLFSLQEREKMVQDALNEADIYNAVTESFQGLLIDFAKQKKATAIVRGLRTSIDFDYELQMAYANKHLAKEIDTIFLPTSIEYSYISSSIVRQVGMFGGDITSFVPQVNASKIEERLKKNE